VELFLCFDAKLTEYDGRATVAALGESSEGVQPIRRGENALFVCHSKRCVLYVCFMTI
jgi:hypothetical protein